MPSNKFLFSTMSSALVVGLIAVASNKVAALQREGGEVKVVSAPQIKETSRKPSIMGFIPGIGIDMPGIVVHSHSLVSSGKPKPPLFPFIEGEGIRLPLTSAASTRPKNIKATPRKLIMGFIPGIGLEYSMHQRPIGSWEKPIMEEEGVRPTPIFADPTD